MPKKGTKSKQPFEVPLDSSIHSIKHLTFQGGGMKGLGYVGALEELEKHGVLSQVEEVAGASAG